MLPPSSIVVYNICGLGNRENVEAYKQSIRSLSNEADSLNKIVISSCFSSDAVIKELKITFPEIPIIRIDQKLAVNATFNKAVQESIKLYGEKDGYIYVASDVDIGHYPFNDSFCGRLGSILMPLYGQYSMVSPEVDKDNGYKWWFGFDEIPNKSKLFRVPLGSTCNLHCQAFSHDIYENFDRRIIPDVFVSYCTESIFSFVCASINKKFCINPEIKVHHRVTMDGSCSVFGRAWELVYPGAKPIAQILSDPLAYEVGMGYEEWVPRERANKPYLIHDPSKFDENGFAKDPRLKDFILDNFYLKKEVLDYDSIPFTIV